MIERYSRFEMKQIWSEENKYQTWLEIELLASEAYSKVNKNISASQIKALRTKAKVDVKRIQEIEAMTKHDVIAFTRQISETLGAEKKWLHYGLTSTDVVDTAQSLRLKQANQIIEKALVSLLDILKKMALKYQDTYQIGRTHGVHAEITTFGYKLALWYDEMTRNLKRFQLARANIEVAKISGAVGNYANIPLSIQEYIAQKLNLSSSLISTQTLQRDRHAEYIFTLALIASSLEKFAVEIRHLQRTEVQEVQEGFAKNQKGSSAMPHKKNPIGSENISGLARIMRGFVVSANENITLWHERDISHSSAERIILQDSTILIDYMINRFSNILENLIVDDKKMKANIFLTHGVIFSQKAMLMIIEKENISRELAYDQIQKLAYQAYEQKIDFATLLVKNKLLTKEEATKLYSLKYYLKNIELVFKRLKLK